MRNKTCHSEQSEESRAEEERSFAPLGMTALDFDVLKKQANGMLDADIYQAIHDTAAAVKNGDIVEIGTAHGAATIALAHGLRQTKRETAKIITIDKIAGGSRDAFGDVDENVKIIHENFRAFGVADAIDFYLGASDEVAPALPADLKIGLLMLDADGAIDRDFRLFYNSLLPGAPIIIDDYKDGYVRVSQNGKRVQIEQKRRITAALVHYFESKNLLQRTCVLNETYFGIKPHHITQNVQFDNEEIMPIYRGLVFAEGDLHGSVAEVIGRATRKFPGLHKALKKIYMRNP